MNAVRLTGALGAASVVACVLFGVSLLRGGSMYNGLLVWNVCLAWLPLGFAWLLGQSLKRRAWLSWLPLVLSASWLGFLPNSFYMVSDYIHLKQVPDSQLLYDVVMFTVFIMISLAVGFMSLLMVRSALRERLSRASVEVIMVAVLLVSSFAVFLGRDLRWNTWDVLLNPAGLLFDVSDRLIRPSHHPQMVLTTTIFFVFLMSCYGVLASAIMTPDARDNPRPGQGIVRRRYRR